MPAINYKKLVSASDFKAAANSLYKRNMSAKRDMQSALICAVGHMDTHGDWTSSIKPLLDVGASYGKNLNVALQEWVLKFTWLAYDDKAKSFFKDKDKVMDLKGAQSTDWWTMEKAAKPVPYDFQKALKTFFDGLAKEASREGSTLNMDEVRSSLLGKVSDLVPAEDTVTAFFAKVADDDKTAVITQLMAMVPAPVQSQTEEAQAEAA